MLPASIFFTGINYSPVSTQTVSKAAEYSVSCWSWLITENNIFEAVSLGLKNQFTVCFSPVAAGYNLPPGYSCHAGVICLNLSHLFMVIGLPFILLSWFFSINFQSKKLFQFMLLFKTDIYPSPSLRQAVPATY